MAGTNVLLDTNVIIRWMNGDSVVVSMLRTRGVPLVGNSVSVISKMELLGYSGLTYSAEQDISGFLDECTILGLGDGSVEQVISLRRPLTRLKLPDAIILATARVHGLRLVTLDQRLAKLAEV